jgi:hypothetical protein
MTNQITMIQPVSFSITYDKTDIDDYLEECEDNNETPTQEGFNLYVTRNFECMLEESPRVSYFDRTLESNWFVINDEDIV